MWVEKGNRGSPRIGSGVEVNEPLTMRKDGNFRLLNLVNNQSAVTDHFLPLPS